MDRRPRRFWRRLDDLRAFFSEHMLLRRGMGKCGWAVLIAQRQRHVESLLMTFVQQVAGVVEDTLRATFLLFDGVCL